MPGIDSCFNTFGLPGREPPTAPGDVRAHSTDQNPGGRIATFQTGAGRLFEVEETAHSQVWLSDRRFWSGGLIISLGWVFSYIQSRLDYS